MDDNQIILLFNLRNEKALAETAKKHGTVCRMTTGKILSSGQINLVLEELSDCIHSSEDVEETIDNRLRVQSMLNRMILLLT